MNKEGEYIKETQCKSCVYREHSPKCMWIKMKRCLHFEKYKK